MRATDIMTPDPVVARPAMPVVEAAELLTEHRVRSMPVVDADGRVVGLVDETDLLRSRFPRHRLDGVASPTVGDVMKPRVTCATENADVLDLVELLTNRGSRLVPILSGAVLVGVVSRRDVLRMLVRDDQAVLGFARWRLADFDPARHWDVSVADGVVTVSCRQLDRDERDAVTALLRSIPGATGVRLRTTRTAGGAAGPRPVSRI